MLTSELLPQADEGEVNVNAELPIGTRVERTEEVMLRLEEMVKQSVPEAVTIMTSGGGQGFGGGTNRGQINIRLVPRDERERTNAQIAQDLRRQLSGLPGVIVRANAAGGNFDLNRMLGGGGGGNGGDRLSLEIRGHDLDDAKRIAQEARAMMETTPGVADVQLGQDAGRPEIAIRVDRPEGRHARHDGPERRHDHSDQRRRHDRRAVPRARQRISDRRPAAAEPTAKASPTSARCSSPRRPGRSFPRATC